MLSVELAVGFEFLSALVEVQVKPGCIMVSIVHAKPIAFEALGVPTRHLLKPSVRSVSAYETCSFRSLFLFLVSGILLDGHSNSTSCAMV